MGDETSSSSRVAWLALIVSVVGLLGTNAWSYVQNNNQAEQLEAQQASLDRQDEALDTQKEALELQEDQLDQTLQQMQESHGILQMEAAVAIHDVETQSWTSALENGNVYYGQTLTPETFADKVYVRLDVTNVGTTATQVARAGVRLDGTDTLYSDAVYCTLEFIACNGPLTVEARSVEHIYVWLNSASLYCRDYVDAHGLVGAIRTIEGTVLEQNTGTRVSFSDDCSN